MRGKWEKNERKMREKWENWEKSHILAKFTLEDHCCHVSLRHLPALFQFVVFRLHRRVENERKRKENERKLRKIAYTWILH